MDLEFRFRQPVLYTLQFLAHLGGLLDLLSLLGRQYQLGRWHQLYQKVRFYLLHPLPLYCLAIPLDRLRQ